LPRLAELRRRVLNILPRLYRGGKNQKGLILRRGLLLSKTKVSN